jgi:DNA-binding NtrC family response regulator
MIDKVAPTEARVLITGPNGTGKELVAQLPVQKKSVQASFNRSQLCRQYHQN